MNKKHYLLDVVCYDFETEIQFKKKINELVRLNQGGYSVAINAEKMLLANKDMLFRDLINNSILPYVDGFGAVLVYKTLYNKSTIKINAPILALEVSNEKSLPIFIFGAKDHINKQAVKVIKQKYNDIKIVGSLNGYVGENIFIKELKKTNPKIVLLALGSPKQELLASRLILEFPNIIFIGCGGAVDIISGYKKRAPSFFVNYGLEWMYRLVKEPKRYKRQLFLPLFLIILIKYKFKSLYKAKL